MRIARIELEHFGSHRATAMDCDRVTFIAGPNNAGKSTVADAVLWALTGRCRGVDGRGVGTEDLIADGAAGARVSLDLAKLGRVTRQATRSGTTLVVEGATVPTQAAQQAALYGALRASEGLIAALLDAGAFLDLAHADAKALLMGVLDVRVPVGDRTLTLAELDAQYKQAYEGRTAAKRDATAIVVPMRPADEAPDLEALETRLRDLREQEKVLVAREAQAAGEASGTRSALERQLAEAHDQVAAAERGVQPYGDLDIRIEQLENHVADLTSAREEFQQQTAGARRQLADADGRLTMIREASDRLSGHSPTSGCVLDTTIPCKTPAKAFQARQAEIQQQLEAVQAEVTRAEAAIAEARNPIPQLTEATRQLEAGRRDVKLRDHLREQLRQAQARVVNLEADLQATPPDREAPAASQELVDLRARISRGDTVIRDARALVTAWKTYTDKLAAKNAATRRLSELEAQVEQLGPKGTRVEALSAAVGVFTERVNEVLARFGYALAFSVEPWRVLVNGRSAARLSVSERLRIGVALQLAIAEASGVDLVAIDSVDLLLSENRAILTDIVLHWGGQVLIAASREEPLALPSIPGVTAYWLTLQDGVTVAERTGDLVEA